MVSTFFEVNFLCQGRIHTGPESLKESTKMKFPIHVHFYTLDFLGELILSQLFCFLLKDLYNLRIRAPEFYS